MLLPADRFKQRLEEIEQSRAVLNAGGIVQFIAATSTSMARQQDRILQRLERAKVQDECGPKLNPLGSADDWLRRPGAPKPKLANEKPQGETVPYDELLEAWREGRVR